MDFDDLEKSYRKVARMACALCDMLRDTQRLVNSELSFGKLPAGSDEYEKLLEMKETISDAVLGLDGINRAFRREPFSA